MIDIFAKSLELIKMMNLFSSLRVKTRNPWQRSFKNRKQKTKAHNWREKRESKRKMAAESRRRNRRAA